MAQCFARLTLHNAVNVPSLHTFGSVDPYAQVVGDRTRLLYFKTAPETQRKHDPLFSSTNEVREEAVWVQLYDKNRLTSDELIGEVYVNCREPFDRVCFTMKNAKGQVVPDLGIFLSLVVRADERLMTDRLRRLFMHYAPDRLREVPGLVKDCLWREDELFRALVQKYGPEPAIRPVGRRSRTTRERVVRLMTRYAPQRVNEIDAVMAKYERREDDLLKEVVAYYGPEEEEDGCLEEVDLDGSSMTSATAAAARGQLASKDQSAPQDADDVGLTALPTPPPPPPPAEDTAPCVRARLQRFFEQYDRRELSTMDELLRVYAGREDEMFAALVRQYGSEAPVPEPVGESPARARMRARLTRFYHVHAPEKLQSMEVILEKYADREEYLLSLLVERYGPEPRP